MSIGMMSLVSILQLLLLVFYSAQPSQCTDVGCVGEKGELVNFSVSVSHFHLNVIYVPRRAFQEITRKKMNRPSRKTSQSFVLFWLRLAVAIVKFGRCSMYGVCMV